MRMLSGRTGKLLLVLPVLIAGFLASAGATEATTTAPGANSRVTIAGNPRCTTGTHLFKVDPPANGTYTLSNGGQVIISNYNGTSFDWAIAPGSLHDIDANVVIVKGGPAAVAYSYDTFDDSDTMLQAPINPNNGRPYGISHITFCFDPKA